MSCSRLLLGTGLVWGDIREITKFVARVRQGLPDAGVGFPSRQAEAIIRGSLGEVAFMDHVHTRDVSYPEIGIAVLGRLVGEWQPGPAEVDAMFRQVGEVLGEAPQIMPDLAQIEAHWFESGMDRSPFAVLAEDAPVNSGEAGRWFRAWRLSRRHPAR